MKREPPPSPDLTACLPTPQDLRSQLALSAYAQATVTQARQVLGKILSGQDQRLLVIVGPCSVHDPIAALDYAQRLQALAERLNQQLFIVMRVYFEKPRTSVGWKGLINDPGLDGSCNMQQGLYRARQLLCAINELGLPCATELLDPLSVPYLQDTLSWAAIGARTVESQTHREMASDLAVAVGFKNGCDGRLESAINAQLAAAQPHHFLAGDDNGRISIVRSPGNSQGQLVLRGGRHGPNYDEASIADAETALHKAGLPARIVVDCSHANSNKQYLQQIAVCQAVLAQKLAGRRSVQGIMLESFIEAGQQAIPSDLSQLRYGCSVTDACLDWASTAQLLTTLAHTLMEKPMMELQ